MVHIRDIESESFDYFEYPFSEYMKDVFEQLECNATDDYKKQYVVFTYSQETVEKNIEYFENCYREGISAYTALTLAHEIINSRENE